MLYQLTPQESLHLYTWQSKAIDLFEMFEPDQMSEEERAAVWLLMGYCIKRSKAFHKECATEFPAPSTSAGEGEGMKTFETVTQEAERLIRGERRDSYGGMQSGMTAVAELWNGYLKNRPNGYDGIAERDVCAMMVLLKIARLPFAMKRDTWTDICGYAGIGAVMDGFDDEHTPTPPEGGENAAH